MKIIKKQWVCPKCGWVNYFEGKLGLFLTVDMKTTKCKKCGLDRFEPEYYKLKNKSFIEESRNMTIELMIEQLLELIQDYDIPVERKKMKDIDNVRWLGRNIFIRNGDRENITEVRKLIRQILIYKGYVN